jgi:DNA-binding transcriptional LysR family regulator
MDALTLDQIRVFLSVVDEGSFPKAAKSLQRAQSAVTYAIRKLEAEIGVPLFDRSAYRSVLTPAGRALLTRARRIAEEAGAFREQARGLASGLEAELSIVLDAFYPMPQIFDALRAFTEQFPTVPPRLYVASLGAAANLVTDGTCAIGLLPSNVAELTTRASRVGAKDQIGHPPGQAGIEGMHRGAKSAEWKFLRRPARHERAQGGLSGQSKRRRGP